MSVWWQSWAGRGGGPGPPAGGGVSAAASGGADIPYTTNLVSYHVSTVGVTEDANGISAWEDQAGSNDLTQSDNTYKPVTGTTLANGHAPIAFHEPNFGGAMPYLWNETGAGTYTWPWTVFAVFGFDDLTYQNACYLIDARVSSSYGRLLRTNSSTRITFTGKDGLPEWHLTLTDGDPMLVRWCKNGASDTSFNIYINGTQHGGDGGVPNDLLPWTLGVNDAKTFGLGEEARWNLYELAAYDADVPDADISTIETHLMTKYGIT